MQIIRTKDEKEKKEAESENTAPDWSTDPDGLGRIQRFIFYLFGNSFIENPSESG